jgi:Ser/Thr protein kinase RdoA (MazF antagonist)
MEQHIFSSLTPDIILNCAESFSGIRFDGTIVPYNSYVNRVFGLTDEDGGGYVIKFYRPGRWTKEAIEDEHTFLNDCAAAEVPVVPPLEGADKQGVTTGTYTAGGIPVYYALFPRLRARTFDIYTDNDWVRTGRAIGRMHLAGQKRDAPHRLQCTPQQTTIPYITMLLEQNLVTPDLQQEFTDICSSALDYVLDAYAAVFGEADENGMYHTAAFQRIHGDCHRGNILEQISLKSPASADTEETSSITLIDFDDMMTGPVVQDLWLLLPGYRKESEHELELLLEGYEEFMCPDDNAGNNITGAVPGIRRQLRLIEPLRFMRNIYFLAWTAVQRDDEGFAERNPDWGSRAFWETEIEDLKTQLGVLEEEYDEED